jgi:amino acid efflux transporter
MQPSGLSVSQGAALTVAAVLGTGVISLPALAAHTAGPASLIAWLFLVLLSIPLAGTFAALGARHPDSGGVSTYVRLAFGPRAAGVVGWCFYFSVPLGAIPACAFAADYVADSTGGGAATRLATIAALLAGVAALNAFGVRVSGRVQLVLCCVLAALLVTATLAAAPSAHWSNATPFAPHGWASVGPAAAVLVWGFVGWEAVTSLTADYRRPRHDLPRATALAVVVVGALYLGVALMTIFVLGRGAGSSKAPLADLMVAGLGSHARPVTTVVAVLLTLGTVNAYFAGGSKLGSALGRDGSLPTWFAHGSAAGAVPRRSLGVLVGLAAVSLALTQALHLGDRSLVLLISGAFTLIYVLATAAALRLLPRRTWAWAAAAISLACSVALLLLTGTHLLWGVVLAILALGYETAIGRRRARAGGDPPTGTVVPAHPTSSGPASSGPASSGPASSACAPSAASAPPAVGPESATRGVVTCDGP